MKSLRILFIYTLHSFQIVLQNRLIFILFILAKSLRIILFLIFLGFLFTDATALSGYTRVQIILFYLTFNLIDTLAQLLFREVYRFRPLVISGGFDSVLIKPHHPLIRVLVGGPDLMDVVMFLLLLSAVTWYAYTFIQPSFTEIISFILLVLNGLFVSAAFHILILGLCIITVSVDHFIMIYRDLTSLLRIPVDVYVEPIRSLLTFVIPLGIMLTFPPKALLGLLSPQLILGSLVLGLGCLWASLAFWRYSLRHYQSASS